MPKCIELLPCDWLISSLCYQAIEQVFRIKWLVSVYDCIDSLSFLEQYYIYVITSKPSYHSAWHVCITYRSPYEWLLQLGKIAQYLTEYRYRNGSLGMSHVKHSSSMKLKAV